MTAAGRDDDARDGDGAPPSARLARAFWDARTAATDATVDPSLLGTVTDDAAVVRHRDRLERAHLERLIAPWLRPTARVLDLGGGAGRVALWLAPRVAEVTVVDASAELLARARARAEREGTAPRLRTVHAHALAFEPDARGYDLVLALDLATYLEDHELDAFARLCARAVAPGGRLVTKDPVTTDGTDRVDERRDATTGELFYRAYFRPRERYAEVFGRYAALCYQRVSCAHPFPFFVRGGTRGAVAAARARPAGALLERLSPWLVRADARLTDVELALRRRPLARHLLAPVPVVQDFYVFAPRPRVDGAPDATPALSVVVIAYNEEACVAPVVRELAAALDAARLAPVELVLVDDGSTDATLARMRALGADDPRVRVVPLAPNRGIGGALRAGFDAARGDFVTWIPADGQIPPAAVVELFGRRHEATMLTTVYRSRDDAWYRKAISSTLNAMIRLRTGQRAKSGGNYLFRRDAWQAHGPHDDDTMMLSTEFRANLRAAGEAIVEVPIDCRARVGGRSKVLNARTIARTAARALRGR
jgi:2-polyprenyl-3-methyl-5-hydroxy-6-metoxy-1,4-benzoquinol methylase